MLHISEISIDKYLREIAQIPVLTVHEEISLAEKLPADWAKEKLIRHNLKFVVTTARKYQGMGMSLADLISEGNLGLIKAANRFDVTKGFKFISYAVWWIKQAIRQGLDEKARPIRIPMNKLAMQNRAIALESKIEGENGRNPNIEEYMAVMELPEQSTKDVLDSFRSVTYLSDLLGADIDADLTHLIGDDSFAPADELVLSKESRHKWNRVMKKSLSIKEADIIRRYYGFDGPAETLEMIGENYGLTRERIRQIKTKAIRKIRFQLDQKEDEVIRPIPRQEVYKWMNAKELKRDEAKLEYWIQYRRIPKEEYLKELSLA